MLKKSMEHPPFTQFFEITYDDVTGVQYLNYAGRPRDSRKYLNPETYETGSGFCEEYLNLILVKPLLTSLPTSVLL